jgi:hypothetical protein
MAGAQSVQFARGLRATEFFFFFFVLDIVHKQVSLVYHVPSSESFQAYLNLKKYVVVANETTAQTIC